MLAASDVTKHDFRDVCMTHRELEWKQIPADQVRSDCAVGATNLIGAAWCFGSRSWLEMLRGKGFLRLATQL